MKNFMIVALALTLGACTTTNNPIYTVKTESGEYVTQVPGWFMACLLYTSPSPRD